MNSDNFPTQFESQSGDQSSPTSLNLASTPAPFSDLTTDLRQEIETLEQRKKALQQEIDSLQATYNQRLQSQVTETQNTLGRLIQEGVGELEQRRQTLQLTVEQLERRQERIRNEMRTTFAGASQDLAIRVQGFKDYLVGSLQDLVNAAEQLQMTPQAKEVEKPIVEERTPRQKARTPDFSEQTFEEDTRRIRGLLDQYRTNPEYYGPPWQLRRTFEPVHAERVSNWFFTQGGRGAIRSMGSRLQNILIASATVSILRDLYEDQLRALILANSPERLGEWRRGLQDCLGITRSDFGPEQGIILFETAEAVSQKADRIIKQGDMPLIVVDEGEDQISLSLLQYPLLLAFAPDPQNPSYSLR
ncbi:MAG: DUF3086 domain-containing protein [Leptolyngbyaceae cyanobacterium bins.59]|nr:DUF3086 domain-containing protein [Leptolyngbyaceae cyanobacterium bins.59]